MTNKYSKKSLLIVKPKVCKTKPPPVPGGPPPGPTLLFWDQFIDTPGTPLINHTPDFDRHGGGWLNLHGGHVVENDYARGLAGTPDPRNVAYVDVNTSPVIVEQWVTMSSVVGDNMGMVFGITGPHNFWLFHLHSGTHMINLYLKSPGWWSWKDGWYEPSIVAGGTYKLTVWNRPYWCSCQLDDGDRHWAGQFPLNPGTKVGMQTRMYADAKQLDYQVFEDDSP